MNKHGKTNIKKFELASNQNYLINLQAIMLNINEKRDCLNHKINRILDNIDYKSN